MEQPAISIHEPKAIRNDDINEQRISDMGNAKRSPEVVGNKQIMEFPINPSACNASDDVVSSVSKTCANNLETHLTNLELIRLVGSHSVLYDSRHRRFNDDAFKAQLWQQIASQLSLEMAKCLSTWAKLRYNYQRHVRRMHKYRRQSQSSRIYTLPRPVMLYEEDLMFLYSHVSHHPPLWSEPTSVAELSSVDDDVTIVAPTIDIIDLDEDYYAQYKISPDQQRLIEAVRAYPQLYDVRHVSYANYRHRGLIWGAIANELHEKATKLMKVWLLLQTRFEWELMQMDDRNSELMQQLSFLGAYIRNTPGTVYKMSLYLQEAWVDPIDYFRGVMNLINVLQMMPELGQMVDGCAHKDYKRQRYHALWLRVSMQLNCGIQICEVTWLVLRNFYLELAEMRKAGYQLQDKWYFENTIGCLYKVLSNRHGRRAQKRAANKTGDSPSPPKKTAKCNRPLGIDRAASKPIPALLSPPPPLPLAIVYPPSHRAANLVSSVSIASSSNTLTIANSMTNSSSNNATTASSTHFTMSRITTAVSVLPKPAASATSSVQSSPVQHSITNITPKGLSLQIPATVQLTSIAGTGRQVPQRPGLQAKMRPPLTPAIPSGTTMPASMRPPPMLPLPKLVPLTVRNDKVPMPSMNTLPKQWLTPASSASATASTITPPPALIRTYRSHRTSGYDEMRSLLPSKSSTPISCSANAINISSTQDVQVEFLECPESGYVLQAKCKGLPVPVIMTMLRTALFIREVLAVPQLHSTDPQLSIKCADSWLQLSRKLHMKQHFCRAIWAFLADNMNLFPKIAPMAELMRPFKTNVKVWEKSHRLFSKFDEIARKYQWMYHKDILPPLMQHFEKYDMLYWDLRRSRPGQPDRPPRPYSDAERQEVWRLARERFPHLNHRDVWSMFKFAFKTYMEDLERGIENPWPQNWWHALEKLRFLVNVRYHPLEPYYYIVHNKFMEEVKRCSMYEALMQPTVQLLGSKTHVATESLMPWETAEAKRLLTGDLRKSTKSAVNEQQVLPVVVPTLRACASSDIRLPTRPTVNQMVAGQSHGYDLPHIDAYELTRLLRCNPSTFGSATTEDKRYAWMRIAKQIKATVSECRLTLQHALYDLRLLKIRDIHGRCSLSHKYYRHMNEIYNRVKDDDVDIVHVHAPKQLYKMVMEPPDTVYPESYLPEINMMTCKPSLVVKNWAYALNALPVGNQDELRARLKQIFVKYANLANIDWPPSSATLQ